MKSAVVSTMTTSNAIKKILIVGSGIAGIAAAHRLIKDGFRHVKIIEATARSGGRIKTGRLGEYGGSSGSVCSPEVNRHRFRFKWHSSSNDCFNDVHKTVNSHKGEVTLLTRSSVMLNSREQKRELRFVVLCI